MHVDYILTEIPVVADSSSICVFLFVLLFPNRPLALQCFKKLIEVVFVGEGAYLPASWSNQVNRTSESSTCRLSKLPPVNPLCELLTLSTVRLAVAIIWTWSGLRGLGLGSNAALHV